MGSEHSFMHRRKTALLAGALIVPALCGVTVAAQSTVPAAKPSREHDPRLSDFQAIEFRRYTTKSGERSHFVQYFDAYFPEAFQQQGAILAGSFCDRKNPLGFVWIRGFHTIDDRAVLNGEFYFGSVWNEHRNTMNNLLDDTDNVLLLRPLTPERGITILPAVDPVAEPNGAQGIIVAQAFTLKPNGVDDFSRQAESAFASYRAAGAREAGVLVTLDAKNNFPQLPVRSDGPFLVWLGIVKNNQMLDQFTPLVDRSASSLNATGLLRSAPELIILDPTPRSRLRWLP